jgi:hypothetical protein
MRLPATTSSFFLAILFFVAKPAAADPLFPTNEERIVDTVLSDGFGSGQGSWRQRTQIIFDSKSQSLARRTYEVFDPVNGSEQDFSWEADEISHDRAGRVSGSGRLLWRLKDRPVYDKSAIVSAYSGAMRHGKADGVGRFVRRDGVAYEGQWKGGRAHGRGRLTLANGEQYEGEFRGGFAEGAGVYIDRTWERFEGKFRQGLREGVGRTSLPTGLSYESEWRTGRETLNSMRIRLAQAGATPPVGGADNIRLGITMERAPKLPDEIAVKDVLLYSAQWSEQWLTVEPADQQMVAAWIGQAELKHQPYSGTAPRDGLFSIEEAYVQPVTFKLDVQNRSQQPVELQSLNVLVRESVTENKPAIDISSAFDPGCSSSFTPEYTIHNLGWGKASNGRMRVGFAPGGSPGGAARTPHMIPVGEVDQVKTINVEKALSEAGVNLGRLKALSGEGKTLPCTGTDQKACLSALQGNSIFGTLGPHLRLDGATVYVAMKGTYEYAWTDAKGTERAHSSPLHLPVGLGVLPQQAECGAGGPPEAVRQKAIRLRLDAQNYTIPVPFRRALPSGRTLNLTLPLDAEKSSKHQLQFVAKLSDGREIKSPPIRLLYYRPRPTPTN